VRLNPDLTMDPAHFDLNDIEHEPTDEQLAALMEAVAEEARRRGALARSELLADLKARLAAATTDPATREPA
jgi:hypothetical protein